MRLLDQLPTELLEKIMGYLPGEDVARCSMVSRRWRSLTNRDLLWKRLLKLEHPDELRVPAPSLPEQNLILDPPCDYKRCYMRAEWTLQKWSHNDYWTFMVEDPLAVAYTGNGAILVVLLGNCQIDVYDLNERRSPKLIQTLPPLVPFSFTNRRMAKLFCTKDRIIVHAKHSENNVSLILCYKWTGTELKFVETIYCLLTQEGKSEFHSTTGDPPLSGHNVDIRLLGLVGDSLIAYDMNDRVIYFWSFTNSTCTGRVGRLHSSREFVFKKLLFICTTRFIIGYDTNANVKLLKEIPVIDPYVDDVVMHFNKKVILAELMNTGDYRIVLAWDWNLTPIGSTTGFRLVHEVALHPKLPIISYMDQNEKAVLFEGYEIITKDLATDVVLFRTPFSLIYGIDTTFAGSGHLSFLHYKYILYLPGYNNDFYKEQILLNWKTGKVIFHEKSKIFHIHYVGSKLIEGNKYYKRKKMFNLRIYT